MTLTALKAELTERSKPEKVPLLQKFFKTGPGQYGEGDAFLGLTVPDCRATARHFKTLPLDDIINLLGSKWHEERLVALLILDLQYRKADEQTQKTIYNFYLAHTRFINSWDLVDLSCRDIVGQYIYHHPELQPTLDHLAGSDSLWERRIAIISTFYFLMEGRPEPTLRIAKMLLPDKHDLIQKANGWMLRELGKRVDEQLLIAFLKEHYDAIPRTTLRYAIERFPATVRKQYLKGQF